ncbi:extracellular solute-binding protein [Oscillospiraceae bacterium MB08-C2-2]|nr:extracellular solute-binding protein [Oscillospiraceae bacterium MB08-C2-2]
MKGNLTRLYAVLLSMVLLLTACGSEGASSSQPEQEGQAKGRYMEQAVKLPEGIGYIMGFDQLADGSYMLFCNKTDANTLGPWYVYQSVDGGTTWQEKSYPWLDQMESYVINDAFFESEDKIYLLYYESTEELEEQINSLYEQNKEEEANQLFRETERFARADAAQVTPMEFKLPTTVGGSMPQALTVASNGDLLGDGYFTLYQADPQTGKEKATYELEYTNYGTGAYLTYDNTLAVCAGDRIQLYDLSTGESTGEILLGSVASSNREVFFTGRGGTSRVICRDPQEDAFWYADSEGIFRVLGDGSVTEKVVDGALNSLGMPSNQISGLYTNKDGSFLVRAQENLYLYTYDETVPTVPSTELKVYSLTENKTIRQAIGLFQKQNPDVKVVYQVGMTGDDSVTTADALRSLSTELLAGKGADILVLDGMPLQSYVEKGALMDISQFVKEKVASNELISGPAQSCGSGEGIYAVPAQFAVPVILGEGVGTLTDLKQLYSWVSSQQNKNFGLTREDLVETFYPVCSRNWFESDGTLRSEAFRSDLEILGQMAKDIGPDEPGKIFSRGGLLQGAIYWKGEAISGATGYLMGADDLAGPNAAIKSLGKGELSILFGNNGVYLPKTILGINARTKQQEISYQFLEAVLSPEVLTVDFDEGLPVNTAAMEQTQKNPYSTENDGIYYSSGYNDPDTGEQWSFELQVIWPEPAYMKQKLEEIEAIATPVLENAVVKEMILTETAPYIEGSRSLEETASALEEKLNLYLAE